MNARSLAECLRIDSASEANTLKAPAKHFATGTARLPGKSIKTMKSSSSTRKDTMRDLGFFLRRDMRARYGSHLALVR